MSYRIHSLYIYPLKSCRGFRVDRATLIDTGFQYDRHWMLVDERGQFLSQRTLPEMTRIHTRIDKDRLIASHPDMVDLEIPLQQAVQTLVPVQIWHDQCQASTVSERASSWFSEVLQTACQLVFLPESEPRPVDRHYAQPGQNVGFADGFPLLVMSLETTRELTRMLNEHISIERFRPNIVIEGCDAYAEDGWSSFRSNDIIIDLIKPCSRCSIPGIDPDTAQKHPALLRQLARFRRQHGKIHVGQNALARSYGQLASGDRIVCEDK